MSSLSRKLRRQRARNHQSKSTGGFMATQTQDTATEHRFSKAQLKHFNELQTEVQRAQAELQKFTSYLAEEHEIDTSKQWAIGRYGFELAPKAPEPESPVGSAEGQSQATGEAEQMSSEPPAE
jgi:hypothetical protein